MKNVSDVIEKVERNINVEGRPCNEKALMRLIINDLEKLDEPEVLMQELPAIPQFVAEWYESEGKRNSWWNWFYKWGRDEGRTELETKTIRWMQEFNEEKFVDIFKRGYTVEEEQKYYVLDKEGRLLIRGFSDGTVGRVGERMKPDLYPDWNKKNLPLTEQEIKDYDERFWPFAVKVEELKE